MVKKLPTKNTITLSLDDKLNSLIRNYSKENNLSVETVIEQTLQEKFLEYRIMNPVTKEYIMIREQLLTELHILESRKILLQTKRFRLSNYDALLDDISKAKDTIEQKLETIEQMYLKVKNKGETIGERISLE